jgi:transcription elongation factor GreB
MNKAFVRESESDEGDTPEVEAASPAGVRNYITPTGFARLKAEFRQLMDVDRPEIVRVVSWAASNGDRSENGDYLYGKKRLREIDRRIRFLTKRLDLAEVVDPAAREDTDQVFFGATVDILDSKGLERTIAIVGVDEVDPARGHVSWIAPIAKALIRGRVGDIVRFEAPGGLEELEILDIRYEAIA